MEVYEVHCEPIAEARVSRFYDADSALREAKRICDTHKIEAVVVRVIGKFTPASRWVSNGVPGYERLDKEQE